MTKVVVIGGTGLIGSKTVEARYFGARLEERSLVPGADARILGPRFDDWLAQTASTR